MLIQDASFEKSYEAAFVDAPADGFVDHEFRGPAREGPVATALVHTSHGSAWTGAFTGETSWRGVTGLYGTPNADMLCLLNRGRAFLVDTRRPENTSVVRTDGPVRSVVSLPTSSLLLLVTQWSVVAVGPDGEAWASERVSLEGLRLDEVIGSFVVGVADPDDDEPREFSLDLRDGTLAGGSAV
jgi:hypothetical protein